MNTTTTTTDSAAIETLTEEYNAYRSAVDMSERIAPQARIPEAAALALAQRVIASGCTASTIVIASACYGFDTALYGVIFEAGGMVQMYLVWKPRDDYVLFDCCQHRTIAGLRKHVHFTYREATLCEVNI